jgi:hypothetical protein
MNRIYISDYGDDKKTSPDSCTLLFYSSTGAP